MDTVEPPPLPLEPPPPPDIQLRPSYRRLVAGGLLGAVAASAVALLLAVQFAKPDIPAEAFAGAPTPSEHAAKAPPVEGLRAEQGRWTADPETWRVTLSWRAVDGATGYLVLRDDRRIGRTGAPTFVDRKVAPETHYRYEVVATGAGGARSKPALLRFETRSLSKADARIQGRWLLNLKVQSSNIGAGSGHIVITFSPTCERGPCDVRWQFFDAGNAGTAERSGAGYRGTGYGSLMTRDCHGGTTSAAATLEFRVEKARTVRAQWRAVSISGTLTESVAAVSNCLSARNVWAFTGAAQA